MRLDIFTVIVLCVCVVGGYLVFTYGYLPDEKLGFYDLEFEINDDVKFITVIGGSHNFFELYRSFDNSTEKMKIRNNIDEKLTMSFLINGDAERPFEFDFPPLSEERFTMYFGIITKEIIIALAGILAVTTIRKMKKPKENTREWGLGNE